MTERARLDPARWSALCHRLGVAGAPGRFEALRSAYSAPGRYYHTHQHIVECLGIFDECGDGGVRRDEVEYALWLHDIIHEPLRSDNEARSANLALSWLPAGGEGRTDRIRALILATQHRAPPGSADEALIQDIDLAILGAPPVRFAEYELQIRREYEAVPLLIFRSQRRAILEGFLGRESIFNLPWFRARYEAQARENLEGTMAGGG